MLQQIGSAWLQAVRSLSYFNESEVARPINGITLNGELEFLLDDDGEVRMFDSPEQAKSFLTAAGVEPEELDHMTIMESCGTCCRCGSPLFKSLLPGYDYQCFTCDEDFYQFEQEAVVADVKNMTPIELASASTYVRSGWKDMLGYLITPSPATTPP